MADGEMVDVLNEQGEVVESILKTEAHERGLLHATVISEIIDSKGRWVFVKQASDRQDAGQFVSPVGGHVQAGESFDQALKREAAEEVGFTDDFKFEHIGNAVLNRFVRNRQENHLFVLYKIFSDTVPVLNEESVEFQYFTEDELKAELRNNPKKFGDAFHFVVKEFFPHLL